MEDTAFEDPIKLPESVERFDEFGFAVFKDNPPGRDERHHVLYR